MFAGLKVKKFIKHCNILTEKNQKKFHQQENRPEKRRKQTAQKSYYTTQQTDYIAIT